MRKCYLMRRREAQDFMRDVGRLESSKIKIHGCSVVKVLLTEKARRIVKLKAAKVFKSLGGRWSSIAKLETGIFGQVATYSELTGNWIGGVHQMREGEPDDFDLKHKGFKIDVKTFRWSRKEDPGTWMVVNWHKFHNTLRSFPYYIGCMMSDSDDFVMILGFISHVELERVGKKVNYTQPYDPDNDLIGVKSMSMFTPISEISGVLDKEKTRCAQTTLKWRKKSSSGQVI